MSGIVWSYSERRRGDALFVGCAVRVCRRYATQARLVTVSGPPRQPTTFEMTLAIPFCREHGLDQGGDRVPVSIDDAYTFRELCKRVPWRPLSEQQGD